jgi:signal peptidase II
MLRGGKGLRKPFLVPFIALIVLILDILTKRIIEYYVASHEAIPVLPFLRIVNVKNTGAAFGLFSNLGNNIFIFFSVVAIGIIIGYLLRTSDRLEIVSLSLILGGAAGNLIDRVTIEQVIDFIDIYVKNWHWPAFNVADSALTIGIFLFFFANMRHWSKKEPPA